MTQEEARARPAADQKIRLTARNTIGCYYDDDDGNAWATFVIEPAGTEPCAACGKQIRGGYARFSRESLQHTYFCDEHIEAVYPPFDQEQMPAWEPSFKRWKKRRQRAAAAAAESEASESYANLCSRDEGE